MSIINYFSKGGSAFLWGSFQEPYQNVTQEVTKSLGISLSGFAYNNNLPAWKIPLLSARGLVVTADKNNFHFVFYESGSNEISEVDLTSESDVSLESVVQNVEMEKGAVIWSFSIPIQGIYNEKNKQALTQARLYIEDYLTKMNNMDEDATSMHDIPKEIERFREEFKGKKTAFIIMQFSKTKSHSQIVSSIVNSLAKHGIIAIRADYKEYSDDLFNNIKVYMHGCDFGIGVFERIDSDDFNPNVSIEVGYMMGLPKRVCFLKDKTLKELPSDLTGKLYKPFDPQDIPGSIPEQLEKWLKDKQII